MLLTLGLLLRGLQPRRRGLGSSGVAAIEFGLVAPVMAIVLFGLYDLSVALIDYRRTAVVAQEAGEMISEMSIQANQTMQVTPSQVQQGASVLFAIFPKLVGSTVITPANTTYAVTVSEVVFAGSPSGCYPGVSCTSYTANVAWSVPLSYGKQYTRACGTLTQVLPTATATLTNIPTSGMTALKAVLVVDVEYDFTPYFGKFIGAFKMKRTIYVNNRSISSPYIQYDPTNATADIAAGTVCTGYL